METVFFVPMLFLQVLIAWPVSGSTCESPLFHNRTLNLKINSRKDDSGEWLTTFHATNSDSGATDISLDLTQNVYQCEGDQAVHIKGIIRCTKRNDTSRTSGRLTFHPKCGNNAGISNDGRSAQKLKLDDPLNGVLLTNRPLRRNELFEVRLDKKNNKFNYCLGIGVTSYTPESFDIPDHMYNLKSGSWMMHHADVYINGALFKQYYGRNLNDLQVGDRVGVLVNDLGTLHFFVNGADQGPAASNIPSIVHGVFELYYNTIKGTIVDSSS